MAEHILGNVSVNGKADVSARTVRMTLASLELVCSGQVTSLAVRIQKAIFSASASAQTSGNARLIKHVKPELVKGFAVVEAIADKYKTISANLTAGATLEMYTYWRDIKQSMSDYLPAYYRDFPQVEALIATYASELTRLNAKAYELLDQFYVNSATYSITRWEDITSIEIIPQRSLDSQRHFVNAKLRGIGTVTPTLVKSVADAFYESEIIEEFEAYNLRVKIVGRRGEPKNAEDIEAAVGDILPAHLTHDLEFTYLPWHEVGEAALVWREADEFTAKGLEEAFLMDREGSGLNE